MSKGKKTDVLITFRLKCDSRQEAEEVSRIYDAHIANFARFVHAASFEILLSDGDCMLGRVK